ncbi:MAG: rod shape-determining protein MreD [Magnetococcales bacterium]|nr:rod shape-determining protein MreD [Magnetococcales bacterium]
MIVSWLIPWLPALTLCMAAIIQELAIPVPAWAVFRPDLVLITLFYWRLYRGDLCGAKLAFLAGILVDMLSGTRLGVHAISHIVLVLVVGLYARVLRSMDFYYVLFVLLFLTCFVEGIQLLVTLPWMGGAARWMLLAGRPVATMLLAPLVIHLLVMVHRTWLEEPHAR